MEVSPAAPPSPGNRSARHRSPRLRRARLLIAVPALLALPLAACGSPGSSSSAAPAASASSGSQSGTAAFAQCVRSHGVPDMPDPQNGHFIMNSAVQSNPNLQSALQACEHLLGAGGLGSGPNNPAGLNFAHCMQTHGVPQFPDPAANGAINVPSSVRNSAQFPKAEQECQSSLQGQ